MNSNSRHIAIGGFVVGALVLAGLLAIFINNGLFGAERKHFTLVYESSVDGLSIGAPVALKGVTIGEVTDITVNIETATFKVLNFITIAINENRVNQVGTPGEIRGLEGCGLAAQLRLQSLLTGLVYVQMDYYPDATPRLVEVDTEYTQFPTVPSDLEAISQNLQQIDLKGISSRITTTLNGLDQIVNDRNTQELTKNINTTLAAYQGLASYLKFKVGEVTENIDPTLQSLNTTLQGINRELPTMSASLQQSLDTFATSMSNIDQASANAAYVLSEDSPMLQQMTRAAAELERTARAMRLLAETLEREPESLIQGKNQQ
ncbi:MlaD family protein [Porticoccus sp. W117]|uniref:MlaD family protein n=1 Tax=Porticoccus sp. W117 TaxID=3054777 RepID=UPI002598AAC1|nr:MlaD family protein [Porticoccus sp. W117]MDM3870025.1 MlaD family protein [Porticoccus sp. W117]